MIGNVSFFDKDFAGGSRQDCSPGQDVMDRALLAGTGHPLPIYLNYYHDRGRLFTAVWGRGGGE
jgi:hypothetical protein